MIAVANPGLLEKLSGLQTDEERLLAVSRLQKVDFGD